LSKYRHNHIILAALPPGAFLCYGLLIAAKNLVNMRLKKRQTIPAASAEPVKP
jgi:NADH:ubiquinone oxidoreductase, D subunit